MTMPALHISTIELPVADLQRAVAWYDEVLGLKCVWSEAHHALLANGTPDAPRADSAVRLLLVETTDKARLTFSSSHTGIQHSVVDFRTDDLAGLHAHLRTRIPSLPPLQPPANAWAPQGFGFSDCDGNRLGAFAYRR